MFKYFKRAQEYFKLHKISQNTCFLWSVFPIKRSKSSILPLSGIFYVVWKLIFMRVVMTLIPKLIIFPTSKQTNKQMKNTLRLYLSFSLELIAFLVSKVLIKLANKGAVNKSFSSRSTAFQLLKFYPLSLPLSDF